MQTVLEEVMEVVYYIDTWFFAFDVWSEYRLMIMQDIFLPKRSYFQSQFVYLASYLGIYSQNVYAHNDSITYMTMVNNECTYVLLPVEKFQKESFDYQWDTFFLVFRGKRVVNREKSYLISQFITKLTFLFPICRK